MKTRNLSDKGINMTFVLNVPRLTDIHKLCTFRENVKIWYISPWKKYALIAFARSDLDLSNAKKAAITQRKARSTLFEWDQQSWGPVAEKNELFMHFIFAAALRQPRPVTGKHQQGLLMDGKDQGQGYTACVV